MEISNSTFYKHKFYNRVSKQFIIDTDFDMRLIVEFDNNTIEEGKIKEKIKLTIKNIKSF